MDRFQLEELSDSEIQDFSHLLSQLMINALEEDLPHSPKAEEDEDDVHYQHHPQRNPSKGAGLVFTNLKNAEETPAEKMKAQGINPFGVYLNLDCQNDKESIIDQWETSLRVAISINKWALQDAIRFIEMTLLGSATRHWKAQSEEDKSVIISGNDIGTIISRFVLGFKHEILGEGYINLQDDLTKTRYRDTLLRLELNNMCALDQYICAFTTYYYHCPEAIGNIMYLDLFF